MIQKETIKILYVVNAKMPNERANGVQIAHTCEGIGFAGVDLVLVTRSTKNATSVADFFNICETFKHVQIPTIDISWIPFRYAIRNLSFFISANLYLISQWCLSFFMEKKIVVYVRGETVLALIPLSYLMPIFFETHQIRNFERLYKFALKRIQGVVVITKRLKKKFVEKYGLPDEKILIARDAVDLATFSSAKPNKNIWCNYGIDNNKKIILYSGTLAMEKGVDTLAMAAQFLPELVHIVFLGGTNEQVCIFREKYGDMKNVTILGRVDYVAVPEHIASADVLVLPDSSNFSYSNLYTSPMKLFEYMASRRPIVASDVPSLNEVLDKNTAYFFKADNPESLATAIKYTLQHEDESKKMAENAFRAVGDFTWEKRTKSIITHILTRI